jgi:acyl-CoA reductase-like NAD-dependent aldehyde dehydrogenase
MTQALRKTETRVFQTVSPIDGSIYAERPYHDEADIHATLDRAVKAQKHWQSVPMEKRQTILTKALDYFAAHADEIGKEITWQMGRPLSQTPNEIKRGFMERAKYMIDIAPRALADIVPEARDGFTRYIKRVPLGVCAIVAPWNYPYLTSVNGIFPAILAGNAVVLKHSHQTPLCADRYAAAFAQAGLPEGVFQFLDLDHADTEKLIADPRIAFVNFTGSVKGGLAVQRAIIGKFIAAGLELGGKDPAYVRADAAFDATVENLVDGAFFNSGQSCCGIERIYVHESLYDRFVEAFVALTYQYRLGDPLDPQTNLGPMVRTAAADGVRAQIRQAIAKGAKALIDETRFPMSKAGTPYLAPQVLVNVDHTMDIMSEETFGPAIGIMKVKNDEEAIALMNDSQYGLTASIWSQDAHAAETLAQRLETGTVFVNRCDYLDPALAWTGIKNSGRGCTLSSVGFEAVTRPMSFHVRKAL